MYEIHVLCTDVCVLVVQAYEIQEIVYFAENWKRIAGVYLKCVNNFIICYMIKCNVYGGERKCIQGFDGAAWRKEMQG